MSPNRGETQQRELKSCDIICCAQTYAEIQVFLGLIGYYRQFIKGFACIAQPLHEHLLGKGASKKSE